MKVASPVADFPPLLFYPTKQITIKLSLKLQGKNEQCDDPIRYTVVGSNRLVSGPRTSPPPPHWTQVARPAILYCSLASYE